MTPLGSQLVGADGQVLLLHLPTRITDEYVAQIRAEVQTRLPKVKGGGLVLNFADVELINSIGITCLLNIEEDCRKRGGTLVLAAVRGPIQQFLQRVKLHQRFPMTITVDEALARFGSL